MGAVAPFIPYIMMAGATISAAGAISSAKAQSQAQTYNAQLNEQNAQAAASQAAVNAAAQRRQSEQAQGAMRAAYGAAGVTVEGSPLDALRMSAENAALDEANILYAGRLKATGYANEATLNRMGATTATQQGYFGAASSLLTGAGHALYSATAASRGTPTTTISSGLT